MLQKGARGNCERGCRLWVCSNFKILILKVLMGTSSNKNNLWNIHRLNLTNLWMNNFRMMINAIYCILLKFDSTPSHYITRCLVKHIYIHCFAVFFDTLFWVDIVGAPTPELNIFFWIFSFNKTTFFLELCIVWL